MFCAKIPHSEGGQLRKHIAESAASSVCKKVRCSSSLLQPTKYVKETIKCKDVNATQWEREKKIHVMKEKRKEKKLLKEKESGL